MEENEIIKVFDFDKTVHVTNDYSLFKTLDGNRGITKRVKKIVDSLKGVGYIPAAVIVNEKMEIIDGQGRFAALQTLGLPVFYVIVPGIGLEECIAMNISSTNWTLADYIKSFANRGNENYTRLVKLIDDHVAGIDTVLIACTGHLDNKNRGLKDGTFELSEQDYKHADEVLDYIDRFVPIIKQRGIQNGRKILSALCFTYEIGSIDNERMYKAFGDYYLMLGGYSSTEQALEALTNVYNYRLRNKVYIVDEYKRYMSSRMSWYDARYGVKKAC